MTVALLPEDIRFYSRKPQESFPKAHRFLTELRRRHRDTQNEKFWHDLTDSQELNWRVWLSQRPDAAKIVGPGIKKFAFVWLDSEDSNTRERRGDFLVQRTDDKDIRLHPQQKANRHTGLKEACLVWGNWARLWDPTISMYGRHEALAAPQGQGASRFPATGSYANLSQADFVGKLRAISFLNHEADVWDSKPHPRGPLRADITEGVSASSQSQFNWPYFVQGRAWYNTHFEGAPFDIKSFEVVWDNNKNQAVFLGTRADQVKFTVNPRARNQKEELTWGTDGIAEV